jgi:hypothetical protein
MHHLPVLRHVARPANAVRRSLMTLAGLLALALPGFAQQSYVGRYDAYAGFMYLDSPHVSLGESGFHGQVGYRLRTWVSLGFDYSVSSGTLTLTPPLLTPALQSTLGAQLGGLVQEGVIPATYSLSVPTDSRTQTFSAGPQLANHHFKAVTIFVRPDLGLIHEVATPKPGDAIAAGIVAQLAPSGKKTDSVVFYGFGGGVDLNFAKHYSLRIQADLVHDHLFSDMLKDGRNTFRLAIGPGAQWGKNVVK